AERVADRHDELADAQPLRGAERRPRRRPLREPEDGQIGERVGAGDLEAHLVAVREGRLAERGTGYDVRRGEEEAVRGDDDAAACAVEDGAPAAALRDAQVRDGRREP